MPYTILQNLTGVPGALAVQAFSGFSMNAEPIAGDQPDRINIADSETGSLALEYTRQTVSNEQKPNLMLVHKLKFSVTIYFSHFDHFRHQKRCLYRVDHRAATNHV